jgi:hypothetical protein
MELTEEELKEFKPVPGYKYFLVSKDGRVYRLPHKSGYRTWEGTLRPTKGGKLTLSQDGVVRTWKVEKLIAVAFGVSHVEVPVHLISMCKTLIEAHSTDNHQVLEDSVDELHQIIQREKL